MPNACTVFVVITVNIRTRTHATYIAPLRVAHVDVSVRENAWGLASGKRLDRNRRLTTMITMEKLKDQSQPASSNLPSHEVYLVRKGLKKDDNGFWNRIGAAWPHKDGRGFNVTLDGDIVIRERKHKDEDASDSES